MVPETNRVGSAGVTHGAEGVRRAAERKRSHVFCPSFPSRWGQAHFSVTNSLKRTISRPKNEPDPELSTLSSE
jgi:hypothetical protein